MPTEDGTDETGGQGAIVHFNGTTWSKLPSPTSSGLRAIWGSSPSDLYVLGTYGSASIWHFDGSDWKQLNIGVSGLLDIWGSSANDIFIVRGNSTILHGP